MDPQTIIAFDLHRMFVGDAPLLFLLEIVARTVIMYLYTLFVARFIGKRGMGQLTPFEFIVVIVLGSAAGDPMFYADVPLLHGFVVLTVVVALEKLINHLTNVSRKAEAVIESTPSIVIREGSVLDAAVKQEGISMQELLMELRMHGVKNVGEVQYAFWEPSGKLSVLRYPEGKEREGMTTIPPHTSTH